MDLFDSFGHPDPDPPAGGRKGPALPALENWMRKNFKPLVIAFVIAAASILTVTHRGPHGVGLGAVEPSRAAPGGGYDLASLRVFDTTLRHINDSYVDPSRVDPKAMLLSALDTVQKQVAEVLVEPRASENKVVVRVDTQQQDFAINEVDSPWRLSQKMKDVFRFVSANVQPGTDLKELEYAATNGMLNTLDPHSVLLEPQTYQEMKLTTKGQFGGLGIIIGVRKNLLTVIKPLPNTPASEAGIKAGDHIVRIDKLSTVNMMLNDAVSRLRGVPGTKVDVWIERAGQPSHKHVLTRAVIPVDSVKKHELLKDGIGYLYLQQFSGNSVEEMRKYLDELGAKEPLRGLILDLRGDPGGLLEQAIKVTDEFVDSGTIVTTVGDANKHRDEKRASVGGQPKIPLAVLVNGGSASASEIVAGALKNLDRAVIIGSRTFGKGSVQVLYDNDDGSALKLTIAQYLTPGDESIQSVGITPDVALEPTAISKKRVSLFREYKGLREQDLDAHLTSKNTRAVDKPTETLRYVAEKPKKAEAKALLRDDTDKDKDPDAEDPEEAPPEPDTLDDDKFVEDYEITFARELLAQARGWHRGEILRTARPFFDRKAAEEQQKTIAELATLGVDWKPVGQASAVRLTGLLETEHKGNEYAAGEKIWLKATVTNAGAAPAGQVRAITRSDDPFMADREFVFGRLGPGETRSWRVPIDVEKGALSRLDVIHLDVFDEKGNKAQAEPVKVKITGLPHPRFSYAYQLVDDIPGSRDNGDGLVQRGEEVRLHVVVRNVGDGPSYKTQATLSNKSGDGVDVIKGRFDVDNLPTGGQKTVDFTFAVAQDFPGDKLSVQMDVYDQVLHEYVTDKLTFPISEKVDVQPATSVVKVSHDKAEVRAGAALDSAVIGHLAQGTVLKVTGRTPQFLRVELEPGRQAFVVQSEAQSSGEALSTAGFRADPQVSPPRLQIDRPPLTVATQTMRLRIAATDEDQVADSFIFVSNRTAKIDHRKVFYRSNRKSQSPQSLSYEAEIPLWPGANTVTVVARQSAQVQSAQVLIVDRATAADVRAAN